MRSKDDNLEQNISRLIKLAGDSEQPSKAFADSLIDNALTELKQPSKNKKSKSWKRALSWAAVILVVCGIGFGILITNSNKTSERLKEPVQPERRINEQAVTEQKGLKPAEIVYTEKVGIKPVPDRTQKTLTQQEKQVAVASKPAKSSELTTRLQDSLQTSTKLVQKDKPQITFWSEAGAEGLEREKMGRQLKTGLDRNGIAPAPVQSTSGKVERSKKAQKYGYGSGYMGLSDKQSMRGGTLYFGIRPSEPSPHRYPMAHGGTTPPNAEPYDAMFFKNYGVNPFIDTEDDHLSTFATDVDTGSYTIVRKYLQDGHLPPEKAVRAEEFINYFKYGYPAPQEDAFAVYAEAAPWQFGTGRKNSYLLRFGLKAKQVSEENRKPAILTFVIDVSGSMNRENRLDLVKKALRLLVEKLTEKDRIGIAVYQSRGKKVMEHKGLDEKHEILATIESLHASGSTFAEEGIRIGYEMAEKAYKKGSINRVILCSDGVANVGRTGHDQILELIKEKAEKGITLSAIGFGMGNYNDVLLERLGDKGNGHYAYVDTIAEARRIFKENLTSTLQVVARDVKVQVDFNPEVVRSYRLIGYENRDVPDEKFRDDKYDGGEVGAGHSVTALYELKLWPDKKDTVATTYVRYKHPDNRAVTEFKSSIGKKDLNESFKESSKEFKLAATVAEFAEILRKSYWAKGTSLDKLLERAQQLNREFKDNPDVIELVDLVSKAKKLMKKANDKPIEAEEQ